MNTKNIEDLLNDYREIVLLPESNIAEIVSKDVAISIVVMKCQKLINEDNEYYQYLKVIPGLKRKFLSASIRTIFLGSALSLLSILMMAVIDFVIVKVFKPDEGAAIMVYLISVGVLFFWNLIVWGKLKIIDV